MQVIDVDGLIFSFPDSWHVAKYDDWAFYRNQFCGMHDGIKGVDAVAFDGKETLWLIEVKDFRQEGRTKPIPLHEEVWKKVYDTLAGLFAAKCNAVDEEQAFAKQAAKACTIKVVLHMEAPPSGSRLFSAQLSVPDAVQSLKRKIKAIDPHPLVVNKRSSHPSLQWSVQ